MSAARCGVRPLRMTCAGYGVCSAEAWRCTRGAGVAGVAAGAAVAAGVGAGVGAGAGTSRRRRSKCSSTTASACPRWAHPQCTSPSPSAHPLAACYAYDICTGARRLTATTLPHSQLPRFRATQTHSTSLICPGVFFHLQLLWRATGLQRDGCILYPTCRSSRVESEAKGSGPASPARSLQARAAPLVTCGMRKKASKQETLNATRGACMHAVSTAAIHPGETGRVVGSELSSATRKELTRKPIRSLSGGRYER